MLRHWYLEISLAQKPLGTYDIKYCRLNTRFSVYAAIFIALATTVLIPGVMVFRLTICCSGSSDGTSKRSAMNGKATSNLLRRSTYSCINFEGKRSLRNSWERSENRRIPEKRLRRIVVMPGVCSCCHRINRYHLSNFSSYRKVFIFRIF